MRDIVDRVNKRLIGRVALNGDDQALLLAETVAIPGIHTEVGCLWGGTAILAALAKQRANVSGHVFSLDVMMGGFWETEDPEVHKRPAPSDIYENLLRLGVAGSVSVIRASSFPWPLADHLDPVTALIDGDHSYQGCLRDWESLKERVKWKIIFHDYHPYYPGVLKVIEEHVRPDRNWEECAQVGRMIVFKRLP